MFGTDYFVLDPLDPKSRVRYRKVLSLLSDREFLRTHRISISCYACGGVEEVRFVSVNIETLYVGPLDPISCDSAELA